MRDIELKCWNRLAKLSWRSFKEAREFARGLRLKNVSHWQRFCKGDLPKKGMRPPDVPTAPNETYAEKGWIGWGDWLGTGNVAPKLRQFRPFVEARNFVRGLGLKANLEWRRYYKGDLPQKGKLPSDIPTNPNTTYADKGWVGWGDWLGTGAMAHRLRKFRSFSKARTYARGLGFKSESDWRRFCKGGLPQKGSLPPDIPATPAKTYADKGWAGMGDWLGTGNLAPGLRQYRSFNNARAFACGLGLRGVSEWQQFCKGNLPEKGSLPADIPATPDRIYAGKGWRGYGDWLGTGNIANFLKQYRPFRKARAFARQLGLRSGDEWRHFYQGNMPGKGALPADIPASPFSTYADNGWAGWGDWLGTGRVANSRRRFRAFKAARSFVRSIGLTGNNEWRRFCKGKLPEKGALPPDIPTSPDKAYFDNGWVSWGDWLGTGTVAPALRRYRSFRKAREFACGLGLKSFGEWRKFCQGKLPEKGVLPADISASPHKTYAGKGWAGVGDWLGTGVVASHLKSYRPFRKARAFARALKLKSSTEWVDFCQGKLPHLGKLPSDIPAYPRQTYGESGWRGYGDWLGTGRTYQTHRRKK